MMSKAQIVGEQTCPRRAEAPYQLIEPPDHWQVRTDPEHPGLLGNGLVTCSYCGSLQPDDFLERVRQGDYVTPTDKNYKAYIGRPYTEEETEEYKQIPHVKALLAAGATAEDLAIPTNHQDAKFYFQHLSPEQCREFVDLYNRKEIKMAYPGHFYRLPFFMVVKDD